MTDNDFKKISELKWEIERKIDDLISVNNILNDYDNFGSDITFKRNKDSYSRSFGSKKFNIKSELKQVLLSVQKQLKEELELLENKFKNIKIV